MDIWNGPWSPHATHHGYFDPSDDDDAAAQPEAGPSNYQQQQADAPANEHHELDSQHTSSSSARRSLPRQRSLNGSSSHDNESSTARRIAPIPIKSKSIPGQNGGRQDDEDEDEDEEEQVCRICRCGPEPEQPLFHPCKCTGSIRYTHQDCLKDWLSHSRKDKCELCDYPFVFRKIYDAHMPSKLPGGLRAAFFARKSGQFTLVALRALVVITIWLAFVPWALINFFRGSLWTMDLLIAAAGGGSSTWSNVSSGALTSASEALFSSSAPAAPSPTALPPRPSAPSLALTVSGQALIGSVISFGFYATPWAGLGGGISLLLDWALRAETAGLLHDIFLGQVLTCVIIVLVLAAWFTREWVVMQLPAQLPDQLRDEPGEQGAAQPAVQDVPPPPLPVPQAAPQADAAAMRAAERVLANGDNAVDPESLQWLAAEMQRARAEVDTAIMDVQQRGFARMDETQDAAEASYAALQRQRGGDRDDELADGPASIEELRRARLAAFGNSGRDEEPMDEVPAPPADELGPQGPAADDVRADDQHEAPDIMSDSDTATERIDGHEREHEHEPLLAGPDHADVRLALAAFQERAVARRPEDGAAAAAAAAQDAAAAAEAEAAAAAADAADLEGDMEGMLEAIGFRGDPVHLLANVSIVVALCSFCIVVGVAMPYLLGRVFGLGKGFLDVVTAPVRMIRWVTDPVFDAAINVIVGKGDGRGAAQQDGAQSSLASLWQQVVKLAQPSAASTTAPGPTPTPFTSAVSALIQKLRTLPADIVRPIEERLVRAHASTANRALCVGVGHFWWMALLALRVVGEDVMRRGHQRPTWWLRDLIGQVLIVVKVLIFLAIEIILFPIGCGLILDLCTLPLRGLTLSAALAAPFLRPLSFTYMRWAIGTLWMFRFGLYVSHIRSLVRPGVLSWIRDPEDPDFQPIKEILDRKSVTQLRKIGGSAVMYGSLILALVGYNVHLAHWIWPSGVLPLRLPQRSLAPYDILAVLFLVPVLNPERLEDGLAWVSRKWWKAATKALRLDGYFFGDATITMDKDLKTTIAGTPTFLARIPATDNAVIGSPLLIYLDDETGQAISERGKEAVRDQDAKIRDMPEPKAKYVAMRLPTNFGRRVRALLFLLWLSMSVGLHALLGALVLGRRLLAGTDVGGKEGQLHDGYALVAGCITLALPMTAAWSLWTLVGAARKKKNVALRLRRASRKAAGLAWLTVALGVVSPALLGVAIDQVILSHLRVSTSQTSLLYAWTLGLLTQELYVQCIDWMPADSRISNAVRELQRRGVRRLRVWPATRDIFLPIASSSLAAIVLPLVISAAVNASANRSSRDEIEALYLGRLVVLAAGLAVLGVRLIGAHLDRFDRELRDEVYLRISQLRNYRGKSGSSRHRRRRGRGHQRSQQAAALWEEAGSEEEGDNGAMSEDSANGSAIGGDDAGREEDEGFEDVMPGVPTDEEAGGDEDATLGGSEEIDEIE